MSAPAGSTRLERAREDDADTRMASISALFEPTSVAVVGASDDPTRIGGRPIRYLREAGFGGAIYPVNPNRSLVQGLPAHATLASIAGAVDLAIVALPAEQVLDALAACAAKGVRVVIVFSAGFAEADAAGAQRQRAMAQIARDSSMRILGPNCLGAFNAHNGFFGTFTQALDQAGMSAGPVAIASQSGACGGHLSYLCRQRGIGIGYWVTTGNEADIELSECLLWLAAAPTVRVIVAYAEAIRDGARFVEALKTARANGKPVVMLKVGRSQVGARAAASHTGALTGEDAVYDAVMRQYGVHRAASIEEMLDIAYGCARGVLPRDRRLGIVTVSGGVGVQMADAAEQFGLETPPMPESGQARIKAMIPFAGTSNPIDLTAQLANDRSLMGRCLDIVLSEGDYASIILFMTSSPAVPASADWLMNTLAEVGQLHPDRLFVLSFAAPVEVVRRFEAAGYLVYEDTHRAVRAVAAMARMAQGFARERQPRPAAALLAQSLATSAAPVARRALEALDEHGAKRLLAAAGIPVLREIVAADAQAVEQAAADLGTPVALKVLSPDIAHKTEVGGVALGLATPQAAACAAREMLARVRGQLPQARLNGVLVSPMCGGGVETICGVYPDPVFGPMVMFGLGGIHVEVLRDVAFRRAPFDTDEALSMIEEIRGAALLRGVRGSPPADIEVLARTLSRLSVFAHVNRGVIAEIDINPFLVLARGKGAFALDALVLPTAA